MPDPKPGDQTPPAPIVTPPPTTPPAVVPPPDQPKNKVDPYMASLLASLGKTIGDDGSIAAAPPVNLDDPDPALEEANKQAAAAKAAEGTPPPATPDAPPPAIKLSSRKKAEAPPIAPAPAAPAAATPDPTTVTPPPPNAPTASEFESSLGEAEKTELELARFAEGKMPEYKGQADALLNFYKRIPGWMEKNPEAAPDSEEFKQFVRENKPKYRPGDGRKIERMQIEESISTRIQSEMNARLEVESTERKRLETELRVKPLIDNKIKGFHDTFSKVNPGEGVEAIGEEVVSAIQSGDFNAAMKADKIAAPIVHSTVQAASEWLAIANGTVRLDLEKNTLHQWLWSFVEKQGNIFSKGAKEEEKIRDGRSFLPLPDYLKVLSETPRKAHEHWTHTDDDILSMLQYNAHLAYAHEVNDLAAAGYVRQPKTSKTGNPPATPTPAPTEVKAPKAGTTQTPGAAQNSKPGHGQNYEILEMLAPGHGGKFAKG